MENRLKQDVLREAAQYNNQILVAHENDDFQVIEQWEAVTEVDVQTPLEVYRELSGKCHNLPSSYEHHALSIALGRLLPLTGQHSSQLCTSKKAQRQLVPLVQLGTCIGARWCPPSGLCELQMQPQVTPQQLSSQTRQLAHELRTTCCSMTFAVMSILIALL